MTENGNLQPLALTGATGFVGRAIVDVLGQSGRSARLLVRNPSQHKFPQHQTIVGDLFDQAALANCLTGVNSVIHVAGAISAKNRADFFRVNVDGTRSLLHAAKQAGVKRFVLISSLAARHMHLSDYASSKNAAEIVTKEEAGDMSTLILRPCAIYGQQDMGTLPLIKSLLGTVAILPGYRENRFSLIHVSDFAQVCIAAADHQATGTLEIDDTSGGYDWNDLANITRKHFAKPNRLLFLPRAVALALSGGAKVAGLLTTRPPMLSVGKVNELYHRDWTVNGKGWPRAKPILLEQGLLQTIQWYRNNGFLKFVSSAVA